MEQATSISPTSKVKDCESFFEYFKGYKNTEKILLLYENISSCRFIKKKYIKFIGIVVKRNLIVKKFSRRFDILWKSANVIKTASKIRFKCWWWLWKIDEFIDLWTLIILQRLMWNRWIFLAYWQYKLFIRNIKISWDWKAFMRNWLY